MVGVLPFFHSFGFTGTLWLPAVERLRRRLPPQSDGRQDDRRARGTLPRDDHHQHADVLLVVHPQVRAGAVRAPALRDRRRRKPARADRRGVQGEVRHQSARRLRLHRDVAGRGRQRARRRGWPRAAARHARRHRRPSAAWRGRQGRRSRHRRGPLFGKEGLLLVKGPEPDAGLSRRARENRRSRFATAGM